MSSPSNSATIRDLLHEVTDGVEPEDRLDTIRAATADSGRRTHRGWWTAGGVGLVAASVVTALALSTGGGPRGSEPGPADESTATSTPTEPNPATSRAVPVYFVGDTPSGPRLYREFQRGTGPMSAETFALDAALSGTSQDPDYRSLWPAGAVSGAYEMHEELITVTLEGDLHDRPAGMTEAEAWLAIEQVVRTAQGSFGQGRIPVQLLLNDARTDQVLGVPTSEPLAAGSDLEVLAHVSLSEPSEGRTIRVGRALTIAGVGLSEDDRISVRVKLREGTPVLRDVKFDLDPADSTLSPFNVDLYLGDIQPGVYDVVVSVTNPDGTFDTDTRRITVVD
ncbi:hypothetical protein EUA06_13755 [Nocardioides glacieisoli]|uniref:Uncharacterized protein n=1 Tax=Nocardioides glacieisoli TaxID=1168730 RepID=A0A4Q2RLT6_9ACTN|nr:GerMN domain-containing protein [Nocardioides glacieisoli]RYB89667.1 hypothetical protein EUA06_13755 [Nocardioides glacieisoli]